jgi:hypothetical protein
MAMVPTTLWPQAAYWGIRASGPQRDWRFGHGWLRRLRVLKQHRLTEVVPYEPTVYMNDQPPGTLLLPIHDDEDDDTSVPTHASSMYMRVTIDPSFCPLAERIVSTDAMP